MNTHSLTVEFGKHKGERYTRVPVSYLFWMVNIGHQHAATAQAEIDRRGSVVPTVEISGHAIDSASLRIRKTWHTTAAKGEGLHAWLCRVTVEALASKSDAIESNGDRIVHYIGVKFVVTSGQWPVLKTVMPSNTHD